MEISFIKQELDLTNKQIIGLISMNINKIISNQGVGARQAIKVRSKL